MHSLIVSLATIEAVTCAWGQKPVHDLPPAIIKAKTVAVVNDTNDVQLTRGAEQALAAWGQFQVVQDSNAADITLRFDRVKSHSGQGSISRGQWNAGYSTIFGSSIHMKVYLKEGGASVYETKTDDFKAKAGISCVNDFHAACRIAWYPVVIAN